MSGQQNRNPRRQKVILNHKLSQTTGHSVQRIPVPRYIEITVAYCKAFSMNEWMSVKELQVLCGQLDFMHIYDQCKLVFWSRISRMKSVVMRTCYGILSRSKEFNLLTYKYDVITGQCTVCDIREQVFANFHNTAVTD